MALSASKYNRWVSYLGGNIAGQPINWGSSFATKCALFTASYTPAITDQKYTSLTNEVANGNGYATGGAAVTTAAVTNSSGTDSYPASLASPTWTASSAGFSLRYMVFYIVSTSATDTPLIVWYDYGSTLTLSGSNGDTFTISLSTANLFTVA